MELISLQYLLYAFLVSLFLHLYLNTSNKKLTNRNKKGLKCYPIVGGLPDFLRNRHRFLDWTTEVLRNSPHNTLIFWRPGNVHVIMTANPSNVEYMLKTNFDNYPKGDHFIAVLQDLVGQGFFNCDGDLWKLQWRTASHEFNTKSLRNFVMDNVTTELSTRLLPILKRASTTQLVMDLQDVFDRFAFDNICKLAFNVDADCLGGDATVGAGFMRAFDAATAHSFGRFLHAFNFVWKLKKKFNMGSELVLKQSVAIVHEFADNIIRSRMKTRGNDEDLLSRFIAIEEISPKFLRDIIVSFIVAGRDTTSWALTWFFWLLSWNPEVELKILNELEMIRTRYGKNTGDTYSFEELRDMHYLHAAISESLRLYPPVPVDTKVCLKDDMLPDVTFVGAGWFLAYNAYAMGRMESIWGRNFHEYLPERWLENGIYRPKNSFRFSVFHAGPRSCLGKDLAYIQIKSVVASVIERFMIKVQDNDKCPQHLQSLTLKMKGGLRVTVKERFVDTV
ncbi:p450 domain-containing protein [Cephalotus follicularis]|uniref:p450 domain-containing protein n=1 Tax=Cephalotus follicularis TaxID=3775 RepID=A0A1Q3BRJ5_CEPFO|nr:p450 domain-containing protein [Cephalotus follicularis]